MSTRELLNHCRLLSLIVSFAAFDRLFRTIRLQLSFSDMTMTVMSALAHQAEN